VRELVYLVAISIDGFIADPDGDIGPLLVAGDHLEALKERYPETWPAQLRDQFGVTGPNRVFDTVVMGARTYRVPGAPRSPYPHLHQVVVTGHQQGIPEEITVWDADVPARVRELKQQPGKAIWLCGGGRLAASLLPQIDRLVLKVSPVVLGGGVPLFSGPAGSRTFAPVTTEVFASGVVFDDYRASGP
jgi:dihydrofolate reductase